jgi:hypothetical protein
MIWNLRCWLYRKWNEWRGTCTADIPEGSVSENGYYD